MARVLNLLRFILLWVLSLPAMVQAEDHVIELPPDSTRLVLVHQLGVDVQVSLMAGSEPARLVDSPIGRTGPELLVLTARDQLERFTMQITGAPDPDSYLIESIDISADPDTIQAAGHLVNVGQLAAENAVGNSAAILEQLQNAVTVSKARPELHGLAQFLLATIQARVGDYGEAQRTLAQLADADWLGEFGYRVDLLRGEITFAQDLYGDARDILQAASDRIERYPDAPSHVALDLAELRVTLGFARVLTGDAPGGKLLLDAALATGQRYGDNQVIGRAYNNLGGYYSVRGEQQEAANHLQLAVEFLSNSGDQRTLTYALSNLSMTYRAMGQYHLAKEAAHLGLIAAEKSSDITQLSGAYTGLAGLYLQMGEYRIASEYANLSSQLDAETNREWRTYVVKSMEADALLGLNQPQQARELYSQVNEYFAEHGPATRYLASLIKLARASLAAGDLQATEEYLNAVSPRRASLSTLLENRLSAIEIRLLLARGDTEEVIERLDTIPLSDPEFVTAATVEQISVLMDAYAQAGDYARAAEYGLRAIEYINTIRSRLDYAQLGPAWSKEIHPIFLKAAGNLLAAYQESGDRELAIQALQVSEWGNAFYLAQQREYSLFNEVSASSQSRELLQELTRLARQRASLASLGESSEIDLAYFRALERYQASLQLGPATYQPAELDLEAVQNELPVESAILYFVCVPGADCHRFLITRDEVSMASVGAYQDIEIYALALLSEMRVPASGDLVTLERISDVLLGNLPGKLQRETSSLQIVSTYPVNTIPFAALQTTREGVRQPLMASHQTTYLPSLSSLFEERKAQKRNSFDFELAILADPDFQQQAPGQIAAITDPARDSLRGWYDELPRLPWSAEEASNLVEIFDGENVRSMVGREANKSNLFDEKTRNARIVHIASHGYFNQATPDLVGVATSPVDGGSGFVTLEELMLHPFNAELVVISGCETNLGENRGGEGMMSLSRAFLGQGANHVIATHWPVSDRASAEFMRLFYTALHSQGMSEAEALRAAQWQLSRNPAYRSPFYWAPYVLTSVGTN